LTSKTELEKLFFTWHHHPNRKNCRNRERAMTDSVMLFPNVLQPTVAMKTYAPMGVKFWESQQTTLDSIKEFSDGWFSRRQSAAQAALEAAKRISEAATPADMHREYQDWWKGVVDRSVAETLAFQQQITKAGSQLSTQLTSAAETAAQKGDTRRSG
jgi:hypothetical protein